MNKHIGSNFDEFLAEEALAESEKQEPVAWIVKEHLDNPISALVRTQRPTKQCNTPLYLRKEWQSLSDDEMKIIQNNSWIIHDDGSKEFNTFVFARAIEAKLKEKNHG